MANDSLLVISDDFGSADFRIDEVLGSSTRDVLSRAVTGRTFIVREQHQGDLAGSTVLAEGLPLSSGNLELVVAAANEPRAYFCAGVISVGCRRCRTLRFASQQKQATHSI